MPFYVDENESWSLLYSRRCSAAASFINKRQDLLLGEIVKFKDKRIAQETRNKIQDT